MNAAYLLRDRRYSAECGHQPERGTSGRGDTGKDSEKKIVFDSRDMDVHGEFDTIEPLQRTGDPYDSLPAESVSSGMRDPSGAGRKSVRDSGTSGRRLRDAFRGDQCAEGKRPWYIVNPFRSLRKSSI